MQFLRAVSAEWRLLGPRVLRTRLGVLLLLLGATLVWLDTRGVDPLIVTLHAGALSAVLSVAYITGSEADRTALTIALTHPTTPLAIATGRWCASVAPATVLTALCATVTGAPPSVAGAGLAAAVAVAGCALAAVLVAGNGAAALLFLLMVIAGSLPPERLVDMAHPGAMRIALASVLELGPALWHYGELARGDWSAVAHATLWAGLGIMLGSAAIARRR